MIKKPYPVTSNNKILLGEMGESIAAEFLREKGYKILKRNYRIGHSDIDILAENSNFLIFTEVRTKSNDNSGMPEETLTRKKLQRMKKTADLYIAFNHYNGLARIDAVCVIIDRDLNIKHLAHYECIG